MTVLKITASVLILSLVMACGGSRDDETDYSQITDVELFEMANQDMKNGNYERAIDNYQRILLDYPISNLHIDCQVKIAEAYGELENFEEQMARLNRLLKENIIPERVPGILVQVGRFYERWAPINPGIITSDSLDYIKAMDYYDQALKYPDSDDIQSKAEAVYRKAMVEAKIGEIDQAISRYKLVTSLYPGTNYSILAQMKLQDPENTNELSVSDSAMTVYRQTLGLAEAPEADDDEEAVDEISEEVQQRESEGNLNDTFKYEENSEGTTDEAINDDGSVDTPVDDSTENADQVPLTPAENDTSGF